MAQVLKYRWDPETDKPIAYYEEESAPLTGQELADMSQVEADRRTAHAMQPGMDMMSQGAAMYADNPYNYPLGLLYTVGGALDSGLGYLTAKAANSDWNPFVETPTERDRFQRELKQFSDVAGLAAGMNPTPNSLMPKGGMAKVPP